MNGSKSKNIRRGCKQLFDLDPTQAIENDWNVPEFAKLPDGYMKVVKGVPMELIPTCGRAKYKELKKMYG